MTEKNLTVVDRDIVNIEDMAMSVGSIVKQVDLINDVLKRVMIESNDDDDISGHYGVIPGTKKKSLLKAGAEKLCLTFRLNPDYDIIREIREDEFIAYTIKCILKHIPTGDEIATGIGSCNSREVKYRYKSEISDRPVPSEYWQTRDPEILGGSQFRPRKKKKQWFIAEQIEDNNPWDKDNTLIKMACKRALIAATLNATAASDIFDQDTEGGAPPHHDDGNERAEPDEYDRPEAVRPDHLKNLWITIKNFGWTETESRNWLVKKYNIESSKDLTSAQVNEAMKYFKDNPKKKEESKQAEPETETPGEPSEEIPMITPGQTNILAMWDISREESEETLQKYFGTSELRYLSKVEADQLIEYKDTGIAPN